LGSKQKKKKNLDKTEKKRDNVEKEDTKGRMSHTKEKKAWGWLRATKFVRDRKR